jgi:hypothetical protein
LYLYIKIFLYLYIKIKIKFIIMKKQAVIIIVVFVSLFTLKTNAQPYLQTHDGISAQVLIEDSLITGCVTASNVTTSSPAAFGAFSNDNSNFPFESGIILASGDIDNAEGPNESSGAGSNISGGGDPDLEALLPGYSINDATVIEFDFVPASDTIRFNYIFGSEEFPEYVGSNYNDVFGFFISGPGINGPYSNNAENIALLPDGNPVTIDALYGTTWYVTSSDYGNAVEYDGLSVNLTAEAILTACETYHIKLAVGDAGDHILDSGVFIESGSFTSGVQINAINHSDVGTDADLYEGCTNYFVLERTDNSPEDEEVVIYIDWHPGSTADEGVDVSEIVDSAYMAPYTNYDTIWYTAFNDGIEEGTETMILEFWTSCPCGNTGGNSVLDTIYIYDAESIKGGIQDVQTSYCGEEPPETLDLVGEVNISPAYYDWSTGETGNTITIEPTPGIETYSVTISDICGNEVYDSVTVRVSSMQLENIDVEEVSCHNACDGSMEINVINDFEPFTYIYANADYFYFEDSLTYTQNPLIPNLCPKDYYVKIVDSIGCYLTTEVTVPNQVNINHSPGIINTSTTYCESPGEITLTAEASVDNATFTWWNGESNSEITVIPPTGENDFWVKIGDGCGNIFEDHITITVSDIELDVDTEPDINENCNGSISAFATGGVPPYSYYWEDPINAFGAEQEDLCAGDYVVIIGDNTECEHTDTVTVSTSNAVIQDNIGSILLYPNPAESHAWVDVSELTDKSVTIQIYTIEGKKVSSEVTTKDVYKTPDLPPGAYMLKVLSYDAQNLFMDKLIITK